MTVILSVEIIITKARRFLFPLKHLALNKYNYYVSKIFGLGTGKWKKGGEI